MPPDSVLAETRAFFGPRAAGWEERFPHDGPQFERAVAELGLLPGASVLDVGCGTGRALSFLQAAVGASGRLIALDATPEMLAEARRLGRQGVACLVLGDGRRLPLQDAAVDAVFAGGFVPHLVEPAAALAELARVTRPGGRLAVFHAIGHATLAARHGTVPSDDDSVSPARLTSLLHGASWIVEHIDDAEERYLALATRA